jgi:hypothetical protein
VGTVGASCCEALKAIENAQVQLFVVVFVVELNAVLGGQFGVIVIT